MPYNLEDLTGKRFGRLVVIKQAPSHRTMGKDENGTTVVVRSYTRWLCKCDCGKEKIAYANHLKSGNTTSCGCYRSERSQAWLKKYWRDKRD